MSHLLTTFHWQQALSTANVPNENATVNVPYDGYTPDTAGGITPYSYVVLSGSLGALSLNAGTGAITGTPTSVETLTAVVRVTDSASPANTYDINVSIEVVGSLTIENQADGFGALTKAGAGGLFPVHSGTISGAEITAGDSSGHWQITDNGYLTPTATGVAAGLNGGPYVLTITGDDFEFVWTISIDANAFDVSSTTELLAVIPINVTPSLVQDKTIYLRPGQYGDPNGSALLTIDRVKPTAANPLLITTRDPIEIDVRTVITKDAGNPGILPRVRILRCNGIIFRGIGFHHNFYEGASDNGGVVSISLDAFDITFDQCEVWAQEGLEPGPASDANFSGIRGEGQSGTSNLHVTSCEIHHVRFGLGTAINGTGNEYIGNHLHHCLDFIHLNATNDNLKFNWNVEHSTVYQSHADFLQAIVTGNTSDTTDIEIIGNRMFSSGDHVQGPFFDNYAAGAVHWFRRVTLIGNIICSGGSNAILFNWRNDDVIARNNTVVRDKRMASGFMNILSVSERRNWVLENNVAETFIGNVPSPDFHHITQINNLKVRPSGTGGTAYDVAFDDTDADGPTVDTLADLMAKLAPKTSGPLDVTPKIGAIGVVDWDTRTVTDLSGDYTPTEWTFTDLTNQTVDTVVTHAAIVYDADDGANVALDDDSLPYAEFRILDTDETGVITDWGTDWTTIDTGQFFQIRMTTSDQAATERLATLWVGYNSFDTWSVTTAA